MLIMAFDHFSIEKITDYLLPYNTLQLSILC
jgi:hypothetical protein